MPINIENNQISIFNPGTLEQVGVINISTKSEVQNTLKIAQEYNEWSSLSLNKRCSAINKFRKIIN